MRAAVLAIAVLCLCSACGASSVARPARRFVVAVRLRPSTIFSRVESVDARGRVVRTLADKVYDASVSPDGSLVALSERNGLYVERVSGSRPRLLVQGHPDPYSAAYSWSPDSRELLVNVSDGARLAVVTVSTGAERILPLHRGRYSYYTPSGWSGPANEILFEDNLGSNGWTNTLAVARPSGTSRRTIYWDNSGGDGAPDASLSPDGKSVAYTGSVDSDSDWNMGTIDVASGKSTLLDNPNEFLEAPVWAPDSTRFAVGFRVFSNRGVLLYSTGIPSAEPVAWTSAGLYLATKPAGSAKLVFVPTGQNSTQTLFSLPHGEAFTSVQPLG